MASYYLEGEGVLVYDKVPGVDSGPESEGRVSTVSAQSIRRLSEVYKINKVCRSAGNDGDGESEIFYKSECRMLGFSNKKRVRVFKSTVSVSGGAGGGRGERQCGCQIKTRFF